MGIVFGYTGSEEPKFRLLQKEPFEIRSYPSYLVAEVTMQEGDGNNGFRVLANYIGVFGTPQNEGGRAMAMTAPVIQTNAGVSMAMTAPVLQTNVGAKKMGFVLPFEYTELDQAPRPTDSRVTLRYVPERVVACR